VENTAYCEELPDLYCSPNIGLLDQEESVGWGV